MEKISVLICHTKGREELLKRVEKSLHSSYYKYVREAAFRGDEIQKIEIYTHRSDDSTIGSIRNQLLGSAKGEYVCFVDDDDLVDVDYFSVLIKGVLENPDCLSMWGIITTDGSNPKNFYHSIQYKQPFENNGSYFRPPNHLNCIKSSIAKNFRFMEVNHGEDMDWAMQISESGVLKAEYKIEKPIYFYEYRSKK